ncbi:hypothetical protein HGRIS_010241 [Hohenbuehelia grisea]
MNYLRGAVNAISAPYQYYKDLPPLNPSTLTGAIDVIVIQRPSSDGGTELACSPFHVRFGKWQVLRPSEKQVKVLVNGQAIPFNMKIGEAGEAFFVFETEEDIPDDLVTSPILQPTRPDEAKAHTATDVPTDRFGAKQDSDDAEESLNDAQTQKAEAELEENQEPEFLDLNASQQQEQESGEDTSVSEPPKEPFGLPEAEAAQSLPSPPPSPRMQGSSATPSTFLAVNEPGPVHEVDKLLEKAEKTVHIHDVDYKDGIAIDSEGYHVHGGHDRDISEKTVRGSNERKNIAGEDAASPSSSRSATPEPDSQPNGTQVEHTQSQFVNRWNESPPSTAMPFASMRATSEPPPDFEEDADHSSASTSQPRHPSARTTLPSLQLQEYSWEWGAFPTPSPMKTTFGKGGRVDPSHASKDAAGSWWSGKGKGKARENYDTHLSTIPAADEEEENTEHGALSEEEGVSEERRRERSGSQHRSRSVPPALEGSPSRSRKGTELPKIDHFDADEAQHHLRTLARDAAGYGAGGRLVPTKSDPTKLTVLIEHKKVTFELSLVPSAASTEGGKVFDGHDEFGAARLFDEGKITHERFIQDADIVRDPALVIRWTGDHYITRSDESPLMDALVLWRDLALQEQASRHPPRPLSPVSDDEGDDLGRFDGSPVSSTSTAVTSPERGRHHDRARSEPPEEALATVPSPGRKPTSSSWVRWWSLSRSKTVAAATEVKNQTAGAPIVPGERPVMRGTTSEPVDLTTEKDVMTPKKMRSDIPPAESAPALPSTPVQEIPMPDPLNATPTASPEKLQDSSDQDVEDGASTPKRRKFAKTLRLTSDQLKSLNLKPGANSITFSLSASGVIACTARIFVWDSTDLVVVSDIDGTITK